MDYSILWKTPSFYKPKSNKTCYHWVKFRQIEADFSTFMLEKENTMRKFIFSFLVMFISICSVSSIHAQDAVEDVAESAIEEEQSEKEVKKENTWKTLSKITYKKEYDEIMGFKIDKPVFSQQVQDLQGKEITIKGYIIPVEGYKSHSEFIFSAFPYNMCFFCGGAGPETVMEVLSKEPVKYTAEQIKIKGKLELNPDDINRLMYQLVDATLVKE